MIKEKLKTILFIVLLVVYNLAALSGVSVDVWNQLVEKTKSLGVFDKLYDGVERKTK